MEPPLYVGEGLPIRNIVHDDDAVGTPVISARYGPESLLARCIPYL